MRAKKNLKIHKGVLEDIQMTKLIFSLIFFVFCQNPETLGTNLQPTPLVRANIRDDLVYKTRNLEDSTYNKTKENESIAHSQKLDNTGIYRF